MKLIDECILEIILLFRTIHLETNGVEENITTILSCDNIIGYSYYQDQSKNNKVNTCRVTFLGKFNKRER